MRTNGVLLAAALAAFGFACGPSGSTTKTDDTTPGGGGSGDGDGDSGGSTAVVEVSLESVGLQSSAIDTTADPCQDFFQYACGAWIASNEIPADRSSYGRFAEIQERNEAALRAALDEQATAGTPLGTFYAACMNEEAIEAAGLAPIEPWLAAIDKIKAPKDVAPVLAMLHTGLSVGYYDAAPVFKLSVDQDFKDATLMIAHFNQSGLGLPERDYYLRDDENSKALRAFYQGHVERMLALSGMSPRDAKRGAEDVMWLETELAKVSKTAVEMRNFSGIYNRVDRAGLVKLGKRMDWKRYFTDIGAPDLEAISVTSKEFFQGLDALLGKAGAKRWRAYFRYHAVRGTSSALPKAFRDEVFALAQKLTGQKEQTPRWRVCQGAATESLRDLVGAAYVERMFAGDAKSAAEAMVLGISDAFAAAVAGYDWMDDATRTKALEKRSMMKYLIGYPARWREYPFELDASAMFANVAVAAKHNYAYELAKLTRPADREEFGMPASIVNAYYNPLLNHMAFPAGILQRPFYSQEASVAVNLGGMGMIVGHELTHGFDDEGAKFAGNGNLENWWSPDVAKTFADKKQCVIDKYAAYEVMPGLFVNGELTLGENIADMGGVKFAYHAYKAMREGKEPVVAGGYSEDQQFFLAVGQAWCYKAHDEAVRQRVLTDPHSPAKFRVNGSVSSLPAFAEAFDCQAGTPMNPENMCTVW